MTTLIPKYYQGASGSVNRAINLKLAESISVLDFGADPTNTTDSTSAIQAAVNAAVAATKKLYIPGGQYKVSSTITIAGGVTIYGDDKVTIIASTTTTGNIFYVTSQAAVSFRNLQISATSSRTAGAAIYYDSGAGTQNNFSVIDNVFFNNQFYGVYFYRNAYQKVTNCQFQLNSTNGICIYLSNATTADSGDQVIAFNQFYGGTGVTCIYQVSGGGTRIIGNKFLQTAYGYSVNFGASAYSAIFIISDNSFDGMTVNSISMITSDATAGLTDIAITGNVLDGAPSDSFIKFSAVASSSLGRVVVTGNTIQQQSGAASIVSLNLTGDATIVGNTFNGTGSIVIGSNCVNPVVASNKLEGVAISNSCTSALIFNTASGATPFIASNGSYLLNTTGTGGGQGVVAIGNATVAPTSALAGGGVLYVQAGALKYIGSSGAVTTIAIA
jgi:parallel beta-helix repeat protein